MSLEPFLYLPLEPVAKRQTRLAIYPLPFFREFLKMKYRFEGVTRLRIKIEVAL